MRDVRVRDVLRKNILFRSPRLHTREMASRELIVAIVMDPQSQDVVIVIGVGDQKWCLSLFLQNRIC